MFFEVYAKEAQRGVISHATSANGVEWKYDRVVLEEHFHLSYPQVFEHEGQFYMTPETGEAGEVRLYRAEPFPGKWLLDSVLLRGRYYDPTVLLRGERWWMWVCDEQYTPLLFSAAALRGPWLPHECNARAKPDLRFGRPGGRTIQRNGEVLRFVQDALPTYGSRLHALRVDALEEGRYAESAWMEDPILRGTTSGWRATGMHHLDAWPSTDTAWIAAVDGNCQRLVFNWRAGARRIQRWLAGPR